MEIRFLKDRIELEKELNILDKIVLEFVSLLDKSNIKYVLVSGYVSILFGRSRTSEDIDIIAEIMDFNKFSRLWEQIYEKFESINTEDLKEAYEDYLTKNHALRFSKKDSFIPNVELKFPKAELDFWTLKERKKVLLNNTEIFISPLEVQIPFKLFLGSEKDIEDARHLFKLFKNKIDLQLLNEFNRKLKIESLFDRYLR